MKADGFSNVFIAESQRFQRYVIVDPLRPASGMLLQWHPTVAVGTSEPSVACRNSQPFLTDGVYTPVEALEVDGWSRARAATMEPSETHQRRKVYQESTAK